jgi:DNA (cytosine-5)-methyltransferase 1
MTNLNVSARAAGSNSTAEHRFPWKWYLSDLAKVRKNGLTVFSCFSCGGGSSMGYKLAGYDVIGNVEIDPRVMEVYRKNNHPKYPYLMDVRDFLKIPDADLPEELFHLDILDGSPPCSVFSTAGEREKGWNKEKVFREGQAKQKLDDLFFYFIQIAEKLKPRVVIAENVSGLLKGNAKGYVNEIFKAFDAAGYKTQLFLLNAAFMGVPQKRERCFFIAQRKDQGFPKIKLQFDEKPIVFGEVRTEKGIFVDPKSVAGELLANRTPKDKDLADISMRARRKCSGFLQKIDWDDCVAHTNVSGSESYRGYDGMRQSAGDKRNIQTFPQDYDFGNQDANFITGMSVPPVMMAQVSAEVYNQWLKP